MISQMSVYPWGGPHVAITHNALDLTVQGPFQLPTDKAHGTPWPSTPAC